MISSHDIEDNYLTEIISVSKILKLSTKLEMKFVHTLNAHIHLTNTKFDRTTNKNTFEKIHGFKEPKEILIAKLQVITDKLLKDFFNKYP